MWVVVVVLFGSAPAIAAPLFTTPGDVTGRNPQSVAVGDFNGDGRQDLVTANTGASTVSVLLGNGSGSVGDGTFTATASPATGALPYAVAVGDFNGDGRRDLVTANNNASTVSVLLGNGSGSTGDGTFTAAASPATGANPRVGGGGRFQRGRPAGSRDGELRREHGVGAVGQRVGRHG